MLETPHDPAASRYEHAARGLRRRDLDPDPIKQFSNWFTAAIEAGIHDVNAMSLATAGRDGNRSAIFILAPSAVSSVLGPRVKVKSSTAAACSTRTWLR